jgi:PleD family two-component response regulator
VSIRILLIELHEDLLCDLRDALISARLVPAIEEGVALEAVDWSQYDVVFCPATYSVLEQVLTAAAKGMQQRRVIAVSRLPEVSEWLDALELGAIDYFAPPFEQSQVRWLLQTHFPSGKLIAA